MPKTFERMISFLIEEKHEAPLEKAAAELDRSVSGYLRHLLLVDLRDKGFIPKDDNEASS